MSAVPAGTATRHYPWHRRGVYGRRVLALNLLAGLLVAAGFFLLFIAAPLGRTDWDRTISLRGRVLGTVVGLVLLLAGLALARA